MVLTFTDIAEVKRTNEFAASIVETVREPLVVLDGGLNVMFANGAFYRTFKVSREETEKRLIYELGNGQWNIPELQKTLGRDPAAEQQIRGLSGSNTTSPASVENGCSSTPGGSLEKLARKGR